MVELTEPPKTHPANERFAAHLFREQLHLFTYLRIEGIDATNYRAEQALKMPIVNRKVWGGNRTATGAAAQTTLLRITAAGLVAERHVLPSALPAREPLPGTGRWWTAGTVQDFLDPFLKSRPGASIDYIHGRESLLALASKKGNLGLYLPPIDKSLFFATVIRDGVMPRKTFSMGEAPEKRFYIEARRITR